MEKNIRRTQMSRHFARQLLTGSPSANDTLEAFNTIDPSEVLDSARANLYHVIENYLGNDPDLKKLADRILAQGGEPLKAVADLRDDYPWDNDSADTLEVIVQVNGARPSFLIHDGLPDLASSPIGSWNNTMDPCPAALQKAIACVGRVERQGQHVGTGFLVGQDLIITNRHVLQGIAREGTDGQWTFYNDIAIDFGREFRGLSSYNRRSIKQVVFCGEKPIVNPLDHSKLDLALLLLDTATAFSRPVTPLPLLPNGGWTSPGTFIFVIGYPGDPQLPGQMTYGNDLLDKLFKKTYGCKRLAPGSLLDYSASTIPWTLTHDATTLAGNSGSLLVVIDNEFAAAGLHYGGSLNTPRQNWGHNLSDTLGQTNTKLTPATLGECLKTYG